MTIQQTANTLNPIRVCVANDNASLDTLRAHAAWRLEKMRQASAADYWKERRMYEKAQDRLRAMEAGR